MACTAFSAVAKAVMMTTSVRGDSAFTRAQQVEPRLAPQPQVAHHQVGLALPELLQRPGHVAGGEHRVPLLGEQDLEELPHGELVVDHQDARHALS